jgi:ADP-ribosyl-[dinitrogen reductase] hydrolase
VLRTSVTDPLQIAAVRPDGLQGRIGVTLCPGKKDPYGGWDRDLDLDLDLIQRWGAATVVTLLEDIELRSLEVTSIGDATRRRQMDWIHLPIKDVSVPGVAFEREWEVAGESLRARLRSGFDVLIHCRGGLGRGGLVAARLLIELGSKPEDAIGKVRRARPGAIETTDQEKYVRATKRVPEQIPSATAEAVKDRAVGALLGLAIGDAVGTTLEFKPRDTYKPLTDMIGGGPFGLKAGEWTDDTAMALALAESLIGKTDLDEQDLMRRFVDWRDKGVYSCTGRCFDIGNATNRALTVWKKTGDPYCGSTDPRTAGNGSLMRLSPVAIRFWHDRPKLRDVAARQSRATHGAPEAIDACVAFAEMLADAIEGAPRSRVLSDRPGPFAGKIAAIMNGSWRGRPRSEIRATGYVAHTLEAAIWSVGRTADFASAVLLAANLGEDADTTAAVVGQLAGALYGSASIPNGWQARVAWSERIKNAATAISNPYNGSSPF